MNSLEIEDDAAKARMAREVFNVVFNHTELFRPQNIGSDLAYLLGAILDNAATDNSSFVDWSPPEDFPLYAILKDSLPADHPVWEHIYIEKDSP